MTLAERFEAKVSRLPCEPGCWLWTGALTTFGYGYLWSGTAHDKAHRVSYELHRGRIPDGLSVLHRCDVRMCVRPDHLFLGTQCDNVHDARRKGRLRGVRGERNVRAKISDRAAQEIRDRYRTGNASILAREYGINRCHVLRIAKGEQR